MTLEERVTRLERENRRLRAAGLIALSLVGSVFLMGQTRVPRRIEAESFAVRTPYGQTVALLSGNETAGPQQGHGQLTLYDTTGHFTFALWPLDEGPRLMVFDRPTADGGMPVKWQAP